MERPPAAVVVCACLLVAGTVAVGPVVARDATTDSGTVVDARGQTAPAITITQQYRLTPDQTGRIDVRVQYSVPDSVTEVRTTLPTADARNPRLDGFERTGDGEFVWRRSERSTTAPSVTYTVPVNATTEARGPEGAGGRFQFVDAGDWALVGRQPIASTGYTYRSGTEPTVTYRNSTAGPGVVGGALVYLGAHSERTRTAHGQQFRLVVPEAATLADTPADIFDSVTAASDRLRVGDRDDTVLMVAAPTTVSWAVRGLQSGDRDLYVRANETVNGPDNVWLHEYVHTRQDFRTAVTTRWLTEAIAQYYAGHLAFGQDRATFDEYSGYLARGSHPRFDDVRLSAPSTWHSGADYLKGALVAGELDRRVRLATNGSASFQTVWRDLNRVDGEVSQTDLLGFAADAGGDDVRRLTRQYTEDSVAPEMWSLQAQRAAFGRLPALFEYNLPPVSSDALRVGGPYGNRTLRSGGLLVGERLVAPVTVRNVGGQAGEYALTVTLGSEQVAVRRGELAPGETTTETVAATFPDAGRRALSTGEDSLTVSVHEPAAPTVTDLSIERDGESATVTATVENRLERPAAGTVTIRRDGQRLTERSLRLGTGETATLTAETTLSGPGPYEFTAGGQTLTVSVDGGGDGGDDGLPGASGPGFGVLAAVLALLLAVGHRIE
jgi:hypothetical protein